jgi:hypothetical protein
LCANGRGLQFLYSLCSDDVGGTAVALDDPHDLHAVPYLTCGVIAALITDR